jgi:glycosyltransferase involved in cell wall biosynthesis
MTDKKLKILYISSPSFLDMDLSFVNAINKLADCYYLLDLYPKLRKATALELDASPDNADIIPMTSYEGFEIYAGMIDLSHSYVINRTSNHPLSLSNVLLQCKLIKFLRQLKPDLIHFNNQIYFNHFYLFLWRKRVLISIHDPFPHSGEESGASRTSAKIYKRLNCLLIRHHLLYNDIMCKEYALDRKIDQNRISTSSLGPYDYFSQTKPSSHLQASDFLFFGRIKKYKGVDLLLDAFAQVVKKHPQATLTIAGSGSFWFDLSEYEIPEHNLRVVNRFIPTAELAGFIRNCKIVVCPYRDATQSGVVMTAYAFHKPVIVTDVGALPLVVEDGMTGYVVEANNTKALADSMERVMSGGLSAKSSYQHIERVYHQGAKSWSAIANRTLAIYRKILSC